MVANNRRIGSSWYPLRQPVLYKNHVVNRFRIIGLSNTKVVSIKDLPPYKLNHQTIFNVAKMRFILLAALLAPLASAAVAGVDIEARAEVEAVAKVEERSLLPLDKRSCVANGCKCSTKHPLKQGQYCGNCVSNS